MIYEQFTYPDSMTAYGGMLRHLIKRGSNVPSRLGMTKEISSALTLINPLNMVMFPFGRRLNYFGVLMESLWVLTDIDELSYLTPWNGGLGNYSDNGYSLYGAYGPRLNKRQSGHVTNLSRVIELLKKDRYTRQAVLPIISPDDVGATTKDFPCNLLVMFKIRQDEYTGEDQLHMTVANRSNDIHWGLFGVNLPQFAMLQNHVAHSVGVQVGTQSHISDSLHLYMESEPHEKITKRMTLRETDNGEILIRNGFYFNHFRKKPFAVVHDHHKATELLFSMFESITDPHSNNGDYLNNLDCSSFLMVAGILLNSYHNFKNESENRRVQAITDLGLALRSIRSDVFEEDPGEFPADWVFGAFCTYVQYAPASQKKMLADLAIVEFADTLEHFGAYDIWFKNLSEPARHYMIAG